MCQISCIIKIKQNKNKTKVKLFKVLLYSGITCDLIANYLVTCEEKKRVKGMTCMPTHREFSIFAVADVKFDLLEFSATKQIKLNFSVFNSKSKLQHNMIIRIEALDKLGIVLDFDENFVKQNNNQV